MSNGKPLRLPIELFKFPDADEYCLYCLPRVGADALLSMSHRLLWDIFTDADGAKKILTPEQKQYLEDTIEGLIMPCTFPDYSQQLSDIAVALSQIQITANCTPDITVNCGADSNFIVYPDPGSPPIINPGPLPDTPIDPDNPIPYPPDFPLDPLDPEGDPPAGWETWEVYDGDACAAANAIVEYAYQYARQNRDFFGQDVYTLAAIIVVVVNILTLGFAVLFSRALIVKIGEVIWKMANWLPLEAAEEFFQDMENYIQANRQDLVCTLYESRLSGSDGMNNFLASIFGFASGTAAYIADASLVVELLGYIFPPSLFAGSIVGGIAYSGENSLPCACDEPYEDPPAGLHWVKADMLEIVQYGTNGQSYESLGSNGIRIFGSNHPGNVKFGYNVRFAPPTGTIAMAMGLSRVTIVSPRLREATGLTSFFTGEILHTSYPALVCGTITAITTPESTFISSYFVKYLSKLTINTDREWAYLGVAASSGLAGLDYDVSISDMYFLVRD